MCEGFQCGPLHGAHDTERCQPLVKLDVWLPGKFRARVYSTNSILFVAAGNKNQHKNLHAEGRFFFAEGATNTMNSLKGGCVGVNLRAMLWGGWG